MKEIKLTKGKVAIVDDEDYDSLTKWSWHYQSAGYAARRNWPENKIILMHREIMATPKGMDTDHKNKNTLDNRRENLRICTRGQNNQNTDKRKKSKSGYRGVSWLPNKKLWLARAGNVYAGKYKNIIDAAKAYDKKAKELYGEFAKLNFNNV